MKQHDGAQPRKGTKSTRGRLSEGRFFRYLRILCLFAADVPWLIFLFQQRAKSEAARRIKHSRRRPLTQSHASHRECPAVVLKTRHSATQTRQRAHLDREPRRKRPKG